MTENRPSQLWKRWKFHLSALVLIAPLMMLPSVLHVDEKLGERVLPEREVGPWTVTLAEYSLEDPQPRRVGTPFKDYAARFCADCIEEIRAAYLHVGERPSIEEPGWPLHGSRYHLHAHVPFPEEPKGNEELWLTVDGWNGEVYQISWPLGDVGAELASR